MTCRRSLCCYHWSWCQCLGVMVSPETINRGRSHFCYTHLWHDHTCTKQTHLLQFITPSECIHFTFILYVMQIEKKLLNKIQQTKQNNSAQTTELPGNLNFRIFNVSHMCVMYISCCQCLVLCVCHITQYVSTCCAPPIDYSVPLVCRINHYVSICRVPRQIIKRHSVLTVHRHKDFYILKHCCL